MIDGSKQRSLASDSDLVQLIQELQDEQQCGALRIGRGSVVVIDGKEKCFYDPDTIAEALCAHTLKGECAFMDLSETRKVQWVLDRKPAPRPMEELLWTIGYTGYRATSCCTNKGCRVEDVIQLKRWPNLTRLPSSGSTIRLASLFSMRPTSIFLASKILKVETDEVMRFYNAACYSGLALRINGAPEPLKQRPHRKQKLVSALFSYLSGRRGQRLS